MSAESILTVGHSTRSLEEFLALLKAHQVEHLVDVRSFPRSRRYPHFNSDALAQSLPAAGIAYTHLGALGGMRKPKPNSINTGWRVEGFRGYADYMDSPEFEAGLEALLRIASTARTAIMCAEAVPWRCHRQLISDALVARGNEVRHIIDTGPPRPHELNPMARVRAGRITYPPTQAGLDLA
jgi:uncharacterized protein (DUF488 family)